MGMSADETSDTLGWGWFEHVEPDPNEVECDDLARSFARCFSGHDGAMVLSHLKETVLHRRLGPNAGDAALRFLEGQRSLAAHIETMVIRGRE